LKAKVWKKVFFYKIAEEQHHKFLGKVYKQYVVDILLEFYFILMKTSIE